MNERIGFVGVGNMGSRMTETLLASGYDVVVFDIDSERVNAMVDAGASAADTAKAVAERVDVLLSSLPTKAAFEDVYLGDAGILAGASAGHLLIDVSTMPPATTEAIATAAGEDGVTLIDAPVIGTPLVAERAELTFMVGGPTAAYDRAEPILSSLGETLWHVGDVGDGHRAKLINNTVMHGNVVIAAEALALAEAAGIDQQLMFRVINAGLGGSEIMRTKIGRALDGAFDAADGSTVRHARKSVAYALNLAFEEDVAMPMAAAVQHDYGLADAAGDGDRDYSVLLRVLQESNE